MVKSALKNFILVPLAAVATAGTFVAAATGAAAQVPPTIKVSYHGLDLATQEGVHLFDKRILSAARQACRNVHQGVGVSLHEDELCTKDLVAGAAANRTTVIAHAGGQRREFASR